MKLCCAHITSIRLESLTQTEELSANEMIHTCQQCHAPLSAGSHFCTHCDAPAINSQTEQIGHPYLRCGNSSSLGAKFCSHCMTLI